MQDSLSIIRRSSLAAWLAAFIGASGATPTIAAHSALPHASAQAVGMRADFADDIRPLINDAIAAKKLPGCVVLIARHGKIVMHEAFGHRALLPEKEAMTLDTVFDMASITKPMATATSIMQLVERGKVRIRDRVSSYLPEFKGSGKEDITIEQLLIHTSGLIPDNAVGDYSDGWDRAYKEICALKLLSPPGDKFRYSDVGFLLLGEIIARESHQSLDAYVIEHICKPLGLGDTGYLPPKRLASRAATTEQEDGEWLRGKVHDPRARLMGGVAGHAGLFSTSSDVATYAQALLDIYAGNNNGILQPRTLREMVRNRDALNNLRGLGWDKKSVYSRNRGEFMSSTAFGHGGFTGTVLWIDPELDLVFVFLSNRVHPNGKGEANDLAGRIATIASAACNLDDQAVQSSVDTSSVLLGIDALRADQFKMLKGQRIGLILNQTSHDTQRTPTLELLRNADNCELVKLFSPEHGIAGVLDQSEIADGVDTATGLPIVSLYGQTRKPTAKQLSDVDTLVFDIQDIGCRFYTYISTMGLAMEAAAESGKRFVVLDRPNPLGGTIVEGPLRDAEKSTFVAYHDTPVRHGMTIGELAKMINHERKLDCDLTIVPMRGWKREHYLHNTGLPWTNPSPNMRSVTQALLYPGIGLFETTNLSVGRGTDTPFELIGAPWLDASQLAETVNQQSPPGVHLVPIQFTPSSSKFAKQRCQGVNFVVTDWQSFRPLDLAWQLAFALRRHHGDDWQTKSFDRLLVNERVFDLIHQDEQHYAIREICDRDAAAFSHRRLPYLLYK